MDFVDMVQRLTSASTSVGTAISEAAECLYGKLSQCQDHTASPSMLEDDEKKFAGSPPMFDDDNETNFEMPGNLC